MVLKGLIQQRFPNTFVGRKFFEEMAQTYSASRIVFNRSIRNDVNMRVFEAVACGSLLVTNDLAENGQAELFADGVHLVTYRDADELLRIRAEHAERRVLPLRAGIVEQRFQAVALQSLRHR